MIENSSERGGNLACEAEIERYGGALTCSPLTTAPYESLSVLGCNCGPAVVGDQKRISVVRGGTFVFNTYTNSSGASMRSTGLILGGVTRVIYDCGP
jgi:hypothetical protein